MSSAAPSDLPRPHVLPSGTPPTEPIELQLPDSIQSHLNEASPHSPGRRTPTSDAWGRKHLLTFDGGGVRGYSSLLILKELMSIIGRRERAANPQAESSHHPRPYALPTGSHGPPGDESPSFKYLPCHYFDVIAGTSTGGLIAIMLGRLRMTVDDCIKEYETLGDKIFGESRWFSVRGPLPALREKYNCEKFKKIVQDVVKRRKARSSEVQESFASDPLMCSTMVLAFKKNPENEYFPYIFRSYDHLPQKEFNPQELNAGKAHTGPIWEVARATAAAPTYFDHMQVGDHLFVDGGFGANNPTLYAFYELIHLHDDYDVVALTVSIGTGQSGSMSRFGEGIFGKFWAYVNFAKKWASDSVRVHLDMQNATQQGRKHAYKRFNVVEGLGDMKMDEWKNKNWARRPRQENKTITHIQNVTRIYLNQKKTRQDLEYIADILVANRRVRSESSRWALVASGERYRCTCTPCPQYRVPFESEDELRQHLKENHVEYLRIVDVGNMTTEEIQRLDELIEQGRLQLI